MAAGSLDVFIEDLAGDACCGYGGLGTRKLTFGTDEHSEFMRQDAGLDLLRQPIGDAELFLVLVGESSDEGWRSVENGNGVAAILAVAIHVGDLWTEQAVGLLADLMRCAVIDAEAAGTSAKMDQSTVRWASGSRVLRPSRATSR